MPENFPFRQNPRRGYRITSYNVCYTKLLRALEKFFFHAHSLDIPQKFLEMPYWKDFKVLTKKIKALLEYPQNSLERLVLFIAEIFSFQGEALLFV